MPNKPYIVMKFGGTSIGTAERMHQVAEIVRKQKETNHPIVVLSAISSYIKQEGTTTRLMMASEACLNTTHTTSNNTSSTSNSTSNSSTTRDKHYLQIIKDLENEHIQTSTKALQPSNNPSLLSKLIMEIHSLFQSLRNILDACHIIDEVSTRTKDLIIGTGEQLSALIFSYVLRSVGLESVYVDYGRVYEKHHYDFGRGEGGVEDSVFVEIGELMVSQIRPFLSTNDSSSSSSTNSDSSSSVIPVVTGYIGYIPNGILNTIGRGYTDYTSALLASSLKSHHYPIQELQIWKEVDGIYTADPKKVKGARLLKEVGEGEVSELTYYGAEVVNAYTMDVCIKGRIGIRIKNAFRPDLDGTLIVPDSDSDSTDSPTTTPPTNTTGNTTTTLTGEKGATAVTLKSDILCLNIHSNRKNVSHGFLKRLFGILDQYGLIVDLISTSEVYVSLALSSSVNQLLTTSSTGGSGTGGEGEGEYSYKLKSLIKDLRVLGEVSVQTQLAILSLVGKHMKNKIGMSGRMFETLAKEGVNIEMISQGASEINISCVILQSDSLRGLNAVHERCVLWND